MKKYDNEKIHDGEISLNEQGKNKKLLITACVFTVLSLIVCVIGNFASISFLFKPDNPGAIGFIFLLPIIFIAYICQLVFSGVAISCSSVIIKKGVDYKKPSLSIIIIEVVTVVFSVACLIAMLISVKA